METLLSKLGVPVEQIVDAADKGATGDGQLDLASFLEGLQGVEDNGQPIVLTDWEKTQLQEIFSKAGVAEELQNRLLPDQDLDTPFSVSPFLVHKCDLTFLIYCQDHHFCDIQIFLRFLPFL